MKQFASRTNRVWLTIVGVLVLVTGLAATVVATGLTPRVFGGAAPPWAPTRDGAVVGDGIAEVVNSTWVIVGIGLVGALLVLLGLGWLLAQVPRTNPARTLRLSDDAGTGLTACPPAVLADVVVRDVEALPGVTRAAAVLRGTAARPQLTVEVTADDRTDVPELLRGIQTEVAGRLVRALEAPLELLGVQVDISHERRAATSVTV